MNQNRGQMNNQYRDKFVGREQEIREIEDMIQHYNFHESYVLNLCGQGGIGKTRLTREISNKAKDIYINTPMKRREKAEVKSIYVNMSGCTSAPSFLFRFRQSLNDKEYNFDKFDAMYQLYYDASAFSKEKEFQLVENKKDKIERKKNGEFYFKEEYLDSISSLGQFLTDYFNEYANSIQGGQSIGLHASLSLSTLDIIRTLYRMGKNSEKIQGYIDVLKEIDRKSGILEREKTLVQYFIDGVESEENTARFFFVDNFLQGNRFENLGAVLAIFKEIKAFWMISSREPLPNGFYNISMELQGLNKEAADEMIKQAALSVLKSEETLKSRIVNFDDISQNIISAVKISSERLELVVVHPLFLTAMCMRLIEVIRKVQGDTAIGNILHIDAEQFKKRDEEVGDAYYFEVGLQGADLDCIHVLACKEVWDEYTLSEIRNRLGLYLLNTRHILASNSMLEIVGKNQIKLHEIIKELLFESPNNRIKYDVFEIMHDAFLEIQEKGAILSNTLLEGFFEFSQQFCTNLLEGNYSYRDTSAYQEFTNFYRAFKVSVKKKAYKAGGDTFKKLYEGITSYYVGLAEKSFCDEDELLTAYESYYDRGLYLSNIGDSQGAVKADETYLKYMQGLKDPLRYAKALNSVGYDLSANHEYEQSCQYGIDSLKVAFEGMEKYVEDHPEDLAARKITDYYGRYFMIGEEPLFLTQEELEEIVSEITMPLQEVMRLKKASARDSVLAEFPAIIEQLLKTRGNIPWYFIHNPLTRQEWSVYAVHYGDVTYLLRKAYYGENAPNTLISYHNTGVYRMKLYENERKGILTAGNREYDKEFQKCCEIFAQAYLLRVKYLKKRVISKEDIDQYYRELEADMQIDFGEQKFTEIYSIKQIERFCPKGENELDSVEGIDFLSEDVRKIITNLKDLIECNVGALESLQYLSNAKYNVAICLGEVEERKKWLDEAIEIADITVIIRSFAIGLRHRKTLESIRYAAEYYYKAGKNDEALKRIKFAVENSRSKEELEVPEEIINEYKKLLEEIKSSCNELN